LTNVAGSADAEPSIRELAVAVDREIELVRTGLVLKLNSGQYVVQEQDVASSRQGTILCTLRGNMRKKLVFSTSGSRPRRVTRAKQPVDHDNVAVGDRVRYRVIDDTEGVIEELLPRSSRFARTAFRGAEQTLVTNLDQLIIVFACAEPNPDLWRIDRWLVAANSNGMEPILVANKRDKVDDATFDAAFSEFQRIGYTVLSTCARTGLGVDQLQESLRGKVSAFTGPSGVGKSSLLNSIQPGLKLATGDIGEVTFKGRHTTTVRELIPLDCGGWVADTPGLRQLELLRMDRDELLLCFLEFAEHAELACRFRDCKHDNEPGCKIKMAVEAGKISRRRYESFLALAKECELPGRQ
jgi:ribosome biogenesis GTPase